MAEHPHKILLVFPIRTFSCGMPAIVSQACGAACDLVKHSETGWVIPVGDVDALATCLREAASDRQRLRAMGDAARKRMATWSPRENADAFARAIEMAARNRR